MKKNPIVFAYIHAYIFLNNWLLVDKAQQMNGFFVFLMF